jgi:RNA polymerase sigma-B factor
VGDFVPGQPGGAVDLNQAFQEYLVVKDEERLRQVMMSGSRLVRHFAKLYASGRQTEDLMQSGYEGLLKALGRFDSSRGVLFSTYAAHCIMGEIRHHIRKEASYACPAAVAELQARINRFVDDCMKENGQIPSLSQIAEFVNVCEEGVVQAMRAGFVSLDEIELHKIQSLKYESFCLPIEDRIVLEQALYKLTELQQRVIHLLFYKDMTQTEAASQLGISQRSVSRILRKSLNLLSRILS